MLRLPHQPRHQLLALLVGQIPGVHPRTVDRPGAGHNGPAGGLVQRLIDRSYRHPPRGPGARYARDLIDVPVKSDAARYNRRRARAAQAPRPSCPALNLCLDYRVRADGAFDLLGVFNTLSVRAFPLRLQLVVHFVLIDGDGRYVVELGAAADADEHAQRAARHEVRLTSPMHVHDGVGTLDLKLAGPGLYWVRLYANDDMVAHRGFLVAAEADAGAGG